MTRDEKAQVAWWLRQRGYSYGKIAALLGYAGPSSAWKLLHPEQTRERYARDNAARGPAKRAWENAHDRGQCACGAPMQVGARRRGGKHCWACEVEIRAVGRAMRQERIAELWLTGLPVRDMATQLGATTAAVNVALAAMRRQSWDVPRRRKGWTDQTVRGGRAA